MAAKTFNMIQYLKDSTTQWYAGEPVSVSHFWDLIHWIWLKSPPAKNSKKRFSSVREKNARESLTPNSPRIPIFYTLTKIYKPTPVGRPIISGESKVICSSVSCSFDRFLKCFLCCVVVTHFPFDSLAFFSLTVENRFLLSEYIVCFSPYFLRLI